MTSVLLVYPYFNPPNNRSIFRFPPLGVGYVASSLRNAGYEVSILDCTFMNREDAIDQGIATAMKGAGCDRIFFGIESGNDSVLKMMNKKITVSDAKRAVEAAHKAGICTGAFFILCYPGETADTVIETLSFATSLPLDYLIYDADFSEIKMKFAILKGQVQFGMRKRLGNYAPIAVKPFEMLTDAIFRVMR